MAFFVSDALSPKDRRAESREKLIEVVHRLRRGARLGADRLIPRRRKLLHDRRQAILALSVPAASMTSGTPARPPLAERSPGRLSGLKVGVVIPSFLRGPGGAERIAGQLATTLAEADSRVDIICRTRGDGPPAYRVPDNVTLKELPDLTDAEIATLRTERYDLLVCFGMPYFYRRAPHIAALLDAPFVIQECTNPEAMTKRLREITDCQSAEEAYWLRQSVLAHASAVRFTMPHYADSVVADVRPFAYAFYNSVAVPAIPAADAEPASNRFICVGAMKNANKNGMAAVEAYCATGAGGDWSLSLFGENSSPEAVATALAAHPRAVIVDEGVVRDIDRIYRGAYALIIPSFEEGLPNVVVEAFSYGVPCIGFRDCAAVAHLITDGVNGLLVDRRDPAELARAIDRLMRDRTLRDELARNACSFAEANFQMADWRRNWLRLIEQAANQRTAAGDVQQPAAHSTSGQRAEHWRRLLRSHRPIA